MSAGKWIMRGVRQAAAIARGEAEPASITFTLPMPPTVNNLFKNAGKRGRVRTDHYAAWALAASAALNRQMVPAISGPVRVMMWFDPEKTRADLDNLCKPTLDALVAQGVIEDDSKRVVRNIVLSWGSEAGAECFVAVTKAGAT